VKPSNLVIFGVMHALQKAIVLVHCQSVSALINLSTDLSIYQSQFDQSIHRSVISSIDRCLVHSPVLSLDPVKFYLPKSGPGLNNMNCGVLGDSVPCYGESVHALL
jgi:hypothetical protein